MSLLSAITCIAYSASRWSSSLSGVQAGTATGAPSTPSSATNTITQCVHRRSPASCIGSRARTSTAKCMELVPVWTRVVSTVTRSLIRIGATKRIPPTATVTLYLPLQPPAAA